MKPHSQTLIAFTLTLGLISCTSLSPSPSTHTDVQPNTGPSIESTQQVQTGKNPNQGKALFKASANIGKTGFDANLSQFAYPYPVKHFAVSSQGQKLKMAYMELSPKKVQCQNSSAVSWKKFWWLLF